MGKVLRGFEDLIFLFGFNTANRGIIEMDLDEAAYLYKVVRGIDGNPRCLVVGRRTGGTEMLLASAGGLVESVGPPVTEEVKERFFKFTEYHDLTGDSFVYSNWAPDGTTPPGQVSGPFSVVVIDPDRLPDYQAKISAYLSYWMRYLGEGGHLFVHDAVKKRVGATMVDAVSKAVVSLKGTRVRAVGSLVHILNQPPGGQPG